MYQKASGRIIRWIGSSSAGLLLLASANAAQVEAPFTAAIRYNLNGQVTGTIAPDPDGGGELQYLATRNTYNAAGLLLRVESGELSVWLDETFAAASWGNFGFAVYLTKEFSYDSYGRKATEAVIGSDGTIESLTQYSYDEHSRVRCKAVRMTRTAYGALPSSACDLGTEGADGPDRIFRFTYDTYDQVLTEERAVGTSLAQTYVTNTYIGRGLPASHTDANGNRTELRYDSNYRLYRRVYPSPTSRGAVNESDYNEYTYDNNGNVVAERKRNGTTIVNTYDGNNRLTFKNLSDNTYSADVSYNYDLRGLNLSARFGSDAGQGVTNAFDGFGNRLSQTVNMGGVSRTLSYRYDLSGNRTRVTHPDDHFFAYGFDGQNRVSGVSESISPSPTSGTLGLLTVTYRPSGGRVSIVRPGAVTLIGLDNALRLGDFTQDFTGTAGDLTNSFAYNPANQITQLSQSNAQYTNTEAKSRVGPYVANGLNQYTQIAGQTITNDANGNLTGDGSLTYAYDMENHLVATGGGVSSSFTYDPLGRLFQVTIAGTTTQFLYDGDALVAEYDSSGSLTRRYVHGDKADEPWVQYNGSAVGASARRYLHSDHQGSIIAHSNAGTVLSKLAYDAYGIPATANIDRFGYTGQAWLKDLGLFHYKARMYSPRLGRFLQTDPIFYADDLNLYAYVGNDPTTKADPSGEIGIIGFLIGAGIETAVQVGTNMASGQDFGEALSNVDVGDVLVAGAVSAVIPGIGNVIKTGVTGAKVVANSVKATKTLSQQSARTANRAAKLEQRKAEHAAKIKSAGRDAADAAGVALAHQAIKESVQVATPLATPAATDSNAPSTPAPAPPPPQPPCTSSQDGGGGCT